MLKLGGPRCYSVKRKLLEADQLPIGQARTWILILCANTTTSWSAQASRAIKMWRAYFERCAAMWEICNGELSSWIRICPSFTTILSFPFKNKVIIRNICIICCVYAYFLYRADIDMMMHSTGHWTGECLIKHISVMLMCFSRDLENLISDQYHRV